MKQNFNNTTAPWSRIFLFFGKAPGGGEDVLLTEWYIVFSKKCSVMMDGCCRKKMLLQVFSYKALLCFFVHSHSCQQMMPSPLCFQTLSRRFSVSRLVAIWGFALLGHVFCGIFQLKGVFLSLESWPRDPPSTGEDGQRWWCSKRSCFELGSTTSRAVRWCSLRELLVAFCCFYLSRC